MLFHTERLRLVSENDDIKGSRYILLGFPFDSTETNIPGQRLGPVSIRDSFLSKETGDLTSRIFDAGDIITVPGNATKTVSRIEETLSDIHLDNNDFIPVLLGGEHTGTYGAVSYLKEIHPDMQVISLDAHYDMKEDVQGESMVHATVMKRISELGIDLHILGARTGDDKEIGSIKDMENNLDEIDASRPVYISIDMDFFDPSIAPGVGDPESGGKSYSDFKRFMDIITKRFNVLGFDIMETNPMIEKNITSSLAADCMIYLLGCLDHDA